MQMTLAHVAVRLSARDDFEPSVQNYLERCSSFARCRSEGFRDEKALLTWLDRQRSRTPVVVVLLDSRGRQMNSEAFAAWLGARRDEGAQHAVFAVGPPDGWSAETLARASLQLSLGPMTMAHTLARLVLAEQLYRAITILTGHPYHSGH